MFAGFLVLAVPGIGAALASRHVAVFRQHPVGRHTEGHAVMNILFDKCSPDHTDHRVLIFRITQLRRIQMDKAAVRQLLSLFKIRCRKTQLILQLIHLEIAVLICLLLCLCRPGFPLSAELLLHGINHRGNVLAVSLSAGHRTAAGHTFYHVALHADLHRIACPVPDKGLIAFIRLLQIHHAAAFIQLPPHIQCGRRKRLFPVFHSPYPAKFSPHKISRPGSRFFSNLSA